MMNDTLRRNLIACLEAGAAARCAHVAHDANPHLAELTTAVDGSEAMASALERCEAWWDGWAEIERHLTPRPTTFTRSPMLRAGARC